jgi:DNA-binding CsgD family transcriptional regulator
MNLLSMREREVIRLVAGGHHNKDIALRLGVSLNTVSTHLRSIYRKLGTNDRAHAVALCFHRRILTPVVA